MKHDYLDIEFAFMFASSGMQYENEAYLDMETGQTHLIGDLVDEEIPEDIDLNDRYIRIPHKNELDLGNKLVFRFVETHIPQIYDQVRRFFRSKGAYAKYKDLLSRLEMLDAWHEYEDTATKHALQKWCAENDIDLK